MTAPGTSKPPHPGSRRRGPGSWGDSAHRPGLLGSVVDAGAVLASAARLLARHWPALLAIFLAAVILRELAMRAAIRVSLVNAELGMMVLLLAPMTTLAALVLMLRVVRPSLPWLGASGGKPPSVLTHLGSVLVPFMTIYYFEDDLYADIREYNYRVWEDFAGRVFVNLAESVETGAEAATTPSSVDRLPYDLSLSLAAVVVGAIVARWLLGRWSATQRHGWLGIPGAYLELVWLTLVLVLAFTAVSELLVEWASTRRIGEAIVSIWEQGAGNASGATSSPDATAAWLLGQLGFVQPVLIIPLSWLAIGAVVIGHEPPGLRESMSGRGRRVYERAQQRWLAAPRAVQWVGGKLTADLQERFTPLVHGVRMLIRAGMVPMLLFCLAFVVVRTTPDWLWQLERLVIGQQSRTGVWDPLAWPLSELNRAVAYTLLVCLLAAAIDRALRDSQPAGGGQPERAEAAAEPPAPADGPAGPPPGNGRAGNGYHAHAPVPPPPGPVPLPPPPLVPPMPGSVPAPPGGQPAGAQPWGRPPA